MDGPSQISVFMADLEHFEGRFGHFYRDTATAGNLTIGLGCLIPDLATAQTLPFWCRDIGDQAARKATLSDVTWDWRRVSSMAPGNRAGFYRSVGTLVYLDDAGIDTLAAQRLAPILAGLAHLFPTWAAVPPGPRRALVDLAWNLGIGGLSKFVKLRAAVESACERAAANDLKAAKDAWAAAAREGQVPGGRKERNTWRSERLSDAPAS